MRYVLNVQDPLAAELFGRPSSVPLEPGDMLLITEDGDNIIAENDDFIAL